MCLTLYFSMKGVVTMESKPLFPLGTLILFPRARERIGEDSGAPSRIFSYVYRHIRGDWGDVHKLTAQMNQNSLSKDREIYSYFITNEATQDGIWIITSGDRKTTRILISEEWK